MLAECQHCIGCRPSRHRSTAFHCPAARSTVHTRLHQRWGVTQQSTGRAGSGAPRNQRYTRMFLALRGRRRSQSTRRSRPASFGQRHKDSLLLDTDDTTRMASGNETRQRTSPGGTRSPHLPRTIGVVSPLGLTATDRSRQTEDGCRTPSYPCYSAQLPRPESPACRRSRSQLPGRTPVQSLRRLGTRPSFRNGSGTCCRIACWSCPKSCPEPAMTDSQFACESYRPAESAALRSYI